MRYLASWVVYAAGDLVSRLVFWVGRGYPIYNRLMIWSADIQGEGSGPWSAPENNEDQSEVH